MSYEKIIINRINALCKQRGISYYRLSKMFGLNQSIIDNIMCGITKNPQIRTLHSIAQEKLCAELQCVISNACYIDNKYNIHMCKYTLLLCLLLSYLGI